MWQRWVQILSIGVPPIWSATLAQAFSNQQPVSPGRLAAIAGNMPASYFGIVLGLSGLGNAWRAAAAAWHYPAVVAEAIHLVAGLVWAALLVLFVLKALLAPAKLAAEIAHPVQCCFIGLAGVSTMLVAGGLLPHWYAGAWVLFGLGALFTVAFGVWRTGGLWRGDRDPGTTTAVLYLPTVAGSFVSAIVLSALGFPDWGQFAFGAGFFSWLAIESVLLNRMLTGPSMPAALRPTHGVQLAPPAVGAVAYISVGGGTPDLFAHALIGYAVLQLLILARLTFWFREAGAVAGFWAFSFGATALATAPLRLIAAGDYGPIVVLGPVLFVLVNLFIAGLVVMTLRLLFTCKMFAAPPAQRPA